MEGGLEGSWRLEDDGEAEPECGLARACVEGVLPMLKKPKDRDIVEEGR